MVLYTVSYLEYQVTGAESEYELPRADIMCRGVSVSQTLVPCHHDTMFAEDTTLSLKFLFSSLRAWTFSSHSAAHQAGR
jgi:hypothetical protein